MAELETVAWCSECHKEILEGEDYYELPGKKTYCLDCMRSFFVEGEEVEE